MEQINFSYTAQSSRVTHIHQTKMVTCALVQCDVLNQQIIAEQAKESRVVAKCIWSPEPLHMRTPLKVPCVRILIPPGLSRLHLKPVEMQRCTGLFGDETLYALGRQL